LLLRSSILRSLCGLDARLLRSLCSLDTTCFGDVDPLSASQLCGAGSLHAGGFLSANTLCASQLACLCLLPCKLCGAVLAKHLSCLLERLLRSLGLNTRKTIQKIAFRYGFLDRLPRTTKGTGAYSLRCATAALLVKLLNGPARLLVDHVLHVRRHVFLHRRAGKPLRWVELKLLSIGFLEPGKGLHALLLELRTAKLKRTRLLRDLLSGLNVTSKNPSSFGKTCNP
jgi:hypothetical protein